MFSERLKKLRMAKKLTQQEMADKFGISRQGYAKYEHGESQPDFDTLENLANFFEVSTDYLIGRSNIQNNIETDKINEFEKWLNDPQTNIFFKEFIDSPEERKAALLKVWEVIKNDKK